MSRSSEQADARLNAVLEREEYGLDDYINDQRQDIHELVLRIKHEAAIDRHILGGSIGKGTSLGPNFRPDFDVNLFFNDQTENSTDDELDEFLQDHLECMAEFLSSNYWKEYKVIYKTAFAVGVIIRHSGIKVDLIPAINFGGGVMQYQNVLDRIVGQGFNSVWINPCYAEAAVHFMKQQEPFVKQVVLMAKYWNKNCVKMPGSVSGRSVIIETVAVKAGQDEMYEYSQASLMRALKSFLKMMATDWKNLCVVVNNDFLADHWPSEAHDEMNGWKQSSGVVLDPVNPFRNFLNDEHVQNKWGYFQDAANDTLKYIDECDSNKCCPIEEAIGLDRLDY